MVGGWRKAEQTGQCNLVWVSFSFPGIHASIQAALRVPLAVPWPSKRDFLAGLQLLSVLQWIFSFLMLGE